MKHHKTPRIELEIYKLCAEIDSLRDEVDYWKERAEKYRKTLDDMMAYESKFSMEFVGEMLKLASQMEDTPDGVLIRKEV